MTRNWRVCNFEGALNASVAHAMVRLTRPLVSARRMALPVDVDATMLAGSPVSIFFQVLPASSLRSAFLTSVAIVAAACSRDFDPQDCYA